MNPNFSGSDYGFWHYRNVGKARMTLQENATTGSRPARKFTPANIQKIKDLDLRALQGASASIARSCPCCLTRTNKAAQALKLLFKRCRRPKSGDP
jgi:hypothetical protein